MAGLLAPPADICFCEGKLELEDGWFVLGHLPNLRRSMIKPWREISPSADPFTGPLVRDAPALPWRTEDLEKLSSLDERLLSFLCHKTMGFYTMC